MASMRDEMEVAIAKSVEVVVATHTDGTQTVRGLDADTVADIAAAIMQWLRTVPLDGYIAEGYAAGLYSRENVQALVDDIDDDA